MRDVGKKHLAAIGFVMAMFASVVVVSAQEVPQRNTLPATESGAETGAGSGIMSGMTTTVPNAQSSESLPDTIQLSNKARVITLPVPVRNIVVGNEGVADVHVDESSSTQVFIIPRGIGTTNIFFMGADGAIIHQLSVEVQANNDTIQAALDQFLPNEKIDVTIFRDTVFLAGNVHSAVAAEKAVQVASQFVGEQASVINMLRVVGSQQVILQVRVSEMDRGVIKQLSANATADFGRTRNLSFTTTSPSTTVTAFASGTFTPHIGNLPGVSFTALERQNLIKTLAEPTLMALSGETASFISGGEIPVPVGVDDNGNAIIEFRDFGISLDFTPVVLDKGRISLEIATEISEVDSTVTVTLSNLTVNGFKTKRTETTVDLPSGGTLMLSGLIENNESNSVSGFPVLKDIPILGALFRSTEFQRDETELVITVTAYLAKPTGADAAMALPTDGFEPASDIDIYLLGRLHQEYGKGEQPFWMDSITGPFGYIMK